jgi:thiamine biosynthesis protein ThiS
VTVTINGQPKQISDLKSLAALIESLGMKADRVAVELNREIVPRSQWEATQIKDGDRLEIVHFVGGGSTPVLLC